MEIDLALPAASDPDDVYPSLRRGRGQPNVADLDAPELVFVERNLDICPQASFRWKGQGQPA